jgi:hypothetical protein
MKLLVMHKTFFLKLALADFYPALGSYRLAFEARRERVASQQGQGNTASSYPLVPI